jgi:hypothetical protein
VAYGARIWGTRSFADGLGGPNLAVPPPPLIYVYGPGTFGASSIGVTAYSGSAANTPGVIPPVVYFQSVSGNLPITGALGPKSQLAIAASMTPTGVLDINLVSKRFAGSITAVGTLTVHATGIHIAGQLAPAGALHKLVARAYSGSSTPTGVVHKTDILVAFPHRLDFTGSVELHRRTLLPDFVGALTPAALLRLTAVKPLVATLFPHGTVSLGIQSPGGYAGTISAAGGLTLTYPGGMTGLASITPVGRLHLTVARSTSGSLSSSGRVYKIGGHHFTGALGVTAVTRATAQRYVSMSGSSTPTGTVHPNAQKRVAGVITPAGSVAKTANLTVSGVITSAGSRTLEGPGSGTASFLADEGTLRFTGRVAHVVTKTVSGTITPAATAIVIYYEPTVLVPGFVYSKYRRGIPLP